MQQMDTPFYGTSIDGSKEQNVKANSMVALTCRSTLLLDNTPQIDSPSMKESDHESLKRITWNKDEEILNGKVSRTLSF